MLMGVKVGDLFFDLSTNTKIFEKQISGAGKFAENTMLKSFGRIKHAIIGGLSIGALGAFSKSCIDLGSDLSEVQNVVDVTFPAMSSQVNEFAKNAINQFGLSETVAKRMTGTYGAMSKAFGFSEKAAYDMGTSLTGLAGDVASFYNIDPTEAYTKLKSVFSGETETLKDLGIVMTQNALDQYAMANGFGKTTAQMTEQEKVMLRLQFVTEQLSAAGGDFARTSDSWANKVRVLSLNFQSLKATIGQGMINVLSPLISLLNTVITKLQVAAKYFVAFTSLITGNKKTSTTLGSVSKNVNELSSGAGKLASNVGGVGSAAKKAAKEMGALAGFDDIKNLSTSKSSGEDAGGGGASGGGLGDDLLGGGGDVSAIPEIDTSGMESTINKMKGYWNDFTNFLEEKKVAILSILSGLTAGLLTFFGYKWLKGIGGLTGILVKMLDIPGVQKVVEGVILLFSNLPTKIGQSFITLGFAIQNSKIFKIVSSIFSPVSSYLSGVFSTISGVIGSGLTAISGLFSQAFVSISGAVSSIVSIVMNLPVIGPIIESMMGLINKIIAGLSSMVGWIGKVLQIVVGSPALLATVVALIVAAIAQLWMTSDEFRNNVLVAFDNIKSVLSKLWENIIQPIFNAIIDICNSVWENGLKPLWNAWVQLVETVINVVMDLWNNISPVINDVLELIGPIFQKALNVTSNVVSTIFNTILHVIQVAMELASNAIEHFGNTINHVFSMVKGIFNGIITFVTGVFSGDWEKAWQGVKDIFSSIVSGFANIFKEPINFIIDGINVFLRGLNKIKIPDWVPKIGGAGFNIPTIPRLAEGGYVKANTPQLAMIGDNRRHGEIVSPEDKMFDVMTNALRAYGAKNAEKEDIQIIVSIMYEILEAIKNLRLIVDGDSLNDDGNQRDKERALRTGKLILE